MAPQYPYPDDRFDLVGRVTRSHGIRGEIKVIPLQGSFDDFSICSRVALVAADGRMTDVLDIKQLKVQGKQIILKLDTIDSKDEADLIVTMGVLIPRGEHPRSSDDLPGDDLIGTRVTSTDNEFIGIIERIDHTGAHPLLIVARGGDEFLIPLVDAIIIERTGETIVIDPPPGLLEINNGDR